MKSILACLVVTLLACGSKTKPAATPETKDTASGSASAATCCCEPADHSKQMTMEVPDTCTGAGGKCLDTEDSCHGIEGPIP